MCATPLLHWACLPAPQQRCAAAWSWTGSTTTSQSGYALSWCEPSTLRTLQIYTNSVQDIAVVMNPLFLLLDISSFSCGAFTCNAIYEHQPMPSLPSVSADHDNDEFAIPWRSQVLRCPPHQLLSATTPTEPADAPLTSCCQLPHRQSQLMPMHRMCSAHHRPGLSTTSVHRSLIVHFKTQRKSTPLHCVTQLQAQPIHVTSAKGQMHKSYKRSPRG